jgi:hypothetical protein
MNRHPSALTVVPLVHGAVDALRDAESQLARIDARRLPQDPLVRAALEAGLQDSLDALEHLTASLRELRSKLG